MISKKQLIMLVLSCAAFLILFLNAKLVFGDEIELDEYSYIKERVDGGRVIIVHSNMDSDSDNAYLVCPNSNYIIASGLEINTKDADKHVLWVQNEYDGPMSEDDIPWRYGIVSYPELNCSNPNASVYSIKPTWEEPGKYLNDDAIIVNYKNNLKGVFNNKLDAVIKPVDADDIIAVFPKSLFVKKNNAFFFLDHNGISKLPFSMNVIDFHDIGIGIVWFKAFQKIGYIDLKKDIYIPIGADEAAPFTSSAPNNTTLVREKANTFLINRDMPGVIMNLNGNKLFNVMTGEVYVSAMPQPIMPTPQYFPPAEVMIDMERPIGLPYDPIVLNAVNESMGINKNTTADRNNKDCSKWQKMYNDAKYKAKVYDIKSDVNLILHENQSDLRNNVKMQQYNGNQAIEIYYRAKSAGCELIR